MNDIFENQTEVVENIRESAKELGADIDAARSQAPSMVAKKNCKLCWGKGWVTRGFPGNKGDTDEFNVFCRCVRQV